MHLAIRSSVLATVLACLLGDIGATQTYAQTLAPADAALLQSYVQFLTDATAKKFPKTNAATQKVMTMNQEAVRALAAIAAMGPSAKDAIPSIVAFIKSPPHVWGSECDASQRQAVETLGKLKATTALEALAADSTWDTVVSTGAGLSQAHAVTWLWRLEGAKAAPILAKVADDTTAKQDAREWTIKLLGCPRPNTLDRCQTPLVDSLIQLMHSADPLTKATAAHAVADELDDSDAFRGPRHPYRATRQKAVPALTQLLADPDDNVKSAARQALTALRSTP